jgi:hypothetical protein
VATVDYSYVGWHTAVAVRSGRVAVATATRDEQRRDDQPTGLSVVSIQLCADPTCTRLGRRVDMTGVVPPRRLSLRILPDGRPVLLIDRDLVICQDPGCSGIAIRHLVEAGPNLYADPVLTIGRNGLPLVAVSHGGLWLHTCTDRMCTAPTKRPVSAVDPSVAQLAVAEAADGTTYVAYMTHQGMVLFHGRQ